MLNVGQIILDLDKNEVMIYAGMELSRNRKTNGCDRRHAFITRTGKYISGSTESFKMNYINFGRDKNGKIPFGSFVNKFKLKGFYFGIFGIIDKETLGKEGFEAAANAIKEFENIGWKLKDGKPVLNE